MNNDILTLLRPNIAALKPYTSARDEFKGKADIYLDANENSLGSPLDTDYSRYPDPLQIDLKKSIGRIKQIPVDRIFLGNGSDEAIDLLYRAFCTPGKDNVVLLPPTYGMYAVQGNIHGAEIRLAPMDADFQPIAADVWANIDANTKMVFVCSPNNPTGNSINAGFIRDLLTQFHGIVVVDEAYIDFSNEPSWVHFLDQYPNLVVLQTLSKCWGLAGLRVGMAFASPLIIGFLNKIKYPYNIGAATLQLAQKALEQTDEYASKKAILLEERARLVEALTRLDMVKKVYPSDANFLLVQVEDADHCYAFLAQNGIVVRNRSREHHCENCLRITVGSPEENQKLLDKLRVY